MNWLFVLSSISIATFLWTIVTIYRNYQTARKIGFPIIISPVWPLNPFYILFLRAFASTPEILQCLPFGLGTWARCTYMGWSFDDKYRLHTELKSSIFTLVTPSGNEIVVADAETAHNIAMRRKDFIKPAFMYEQLNVFGPNVNTVEGKDWERQRRLTAPSFNEKTSAAVWDEAGRQTDEMVDGWAKGGSEGTLETVADTSTLALHVLSRVGFGIEYPFKGGLRELHSDVHTMTYRDALLRCMQSIVFFAIFSKRFLTSSYLPEKLRVVGTAMQEFQAYMDEFVAHERSMAAKSEVPRSNLMTTLIQASDDPDEAHTRGLSNPEIFGNIFAFNIAGHETTANTIAAALVLLAANPQYQDWIMEEIDAVANALQQQAPTQSHTSDSRTSLPYESTFPKLRRCLAIMYETLRLHGSIVFIPKTTGSNTQSIALNNEGSNSDASIVGREYVLPPNTAININVQALHTNPKTWGPDALEWKPDRWLYRTHTTSSSSAAKTDINVLGEEEEFIEPAKGSFIPWADGPRVCLGRKFSQVEFVSVISTLFRKYRVRPMPAGAMDASDAAGTAQKKQDEEEGRKRLMRMINEMGIMSITVQMKKPRDWGLVWEERESEL